jgi:hypothetical protein
MTLALLAPTFTGAAAADPWFRDGTTASTSTVKQYGHVAIGKSSKSKASTSTCAFRDRGDEFMSPSAARLCLQLPRR